MFRRRFAWLMRGGSDWKGLLGRSLSGAGAIWTGQLYTKVVPWKEDAAKVLPPHPIVIAYEPRFSANS